MNYFSIFLFLFALSSCAQEDITLNQFIDTTIEFEKQQMALDSNSFSLMIPIGWNWKSEDEDCDGKNMVIMVNAISPVDKGGHFDLISIQKVKSQSNSNNLQTEYNYLLKLSKNQSKGLKMVESGKTDVLSYPAYFIHTKSNTGNYGETEIISFILNSDEQGFFYLLTAGASQTEDLKKNMSIMLQSLKTFKIK